MIDEIYLETSLWRTREKREKISAIGTFVPLDVSEERVSNWFKKNDKKLCGRMKDRQCDMEQIEKLKKKYNKKINAMTICENENK